MTTRILANWTHTVIHQFASPGGKISLQVASVAFTFVRRVLSIKKKVMGKMLVANGVEQKEVCVQWYQFVSKFEIP